MVPPPVWLMALFLLAILISAAAFWWRARVVVANIRGSKVDADFSLTPIGPRISRFVGEVLFQTKVIRERPIAGIAHALVFWGFCAFALVTLNHFALGFGVELIHRETYWGRFYFGLAGWFAFLVALSITGLAIRRFIVQPRWLGKVHWESGFIALLILTLMLTYLADYGTPGSRAIWWTHTLALLIFLPLVPHTKHLHLMLSPAAIFLNRGSFSKIPPLVGDDDFGLDTGKDITQLAALQAYSCVECGRCTQHCPAYNTGKELNPKEIILGFRSFLNANGPNAEAQLFGVYLSQEAVFQCTTCGACENQCPVGVEHLPLLVGLRRGAVNTGKWEDDHGAKLFRNLERTGNPLGMASSERDKFIAKAELPLYDGSQEYLLWLGCMGAYDPKGRESTEALAKVMRHLNVTFGVLKKEKCTGDSARRLGNDLLFGELAQQNLDAITKTGAKKMISICPHCVRTIGVDWKEYGTAPAIEHHSAFLARNATKLPAVAAGEQKVTYHDPCYLGRYQGIYDEPRAVAALAGPITEPDRNKSNSFCCGAGGGLAFLGEETGERISHNRAKELIATGADVIAAACPFCNTMLRDAVNGQTGRKPELIDIAQIAAARLPAS
jgi:Fe-S oxidoreductase